MAAFVASRLDMRDEDFNSNRCPSKNLPMLKQLHDQLLAAKPDGANHSTAACSMCGPEGASQAASNPKDGSVKTYTEAEMAIALSEVAELKTRVADLVSASQESEVEARLAEATAAFEGQIAELQSQLDTAVLEAQAAKDEATSITTYLKDAADAEALAAEQLARRDERVSAVKEAASFPESYVDANADRFAAMDEDTFTAALADWAAIAPKSTELVEEKVIVPETSLTASRENSTTSSDWDAIRVRNQGVDIRAIR